MPRAITIYPDKRVEEVEITGLTAYQAVVKGLIEPVALADGSTMYVNESYLYAFNAEDFNSIATDVAGVCGRPDLLLQTIRGPVIVVGPLDAEGNDTDVTPALRRIIRRVASEAGPARVGPEHEFEVRSAEGAGWAEIEIVVRPVTDERRRPDGRSPHRI